MPHVTLQEDHWDRVHIMHPMINHPHACTYKSSIYNALLMIEVQNHILRYDFLWQSLRLQKPNGIRRSGPKSTRLPFEKGKY
jgi:hypothetical protein